MSAKFYENALKALKKANKVRRAKLAEAAGYHTVAEYENFLQSMANPTSGMDQRPNIIDWPSGKPVIYVADVIDCSASMTGPKLLSAITGINNGVNEMKREFKVRYKHILCDFSGNKDINFSPLRDILDVPTISFGARDMTALNDAVIQTINTLKSFRKNSEKVLVNIYTDGMENNSYSGKDKVRELINQVSQDGFTITFIGTETDTQNAIVDFNIHESNTVTYNGTADGLSMAMQSVNSARSAYANKVLEGKDVTKGFFKDIKK